MPRQKATPSKHANESTAARETINKEAAESAKFPLALDLKKVEREREEDEESGITSGSSGPRSISGTMTPTMIDGGDDEDDFDQSDQSLGLSPNPNFSFEPKVAQWLTERFVISKGACSTVQDIINQYRSEFPKDFLFAPLQSYQVGSLIRRYFPTIGRTKISVAGRRVWVYKDLGQRASSAADNPAPATPIVEQAQAVQKQAATDTWSSSGSNYRKAKMMAESGLPTMLSYMDQVQDEAMPKRPNSSNDYDNYAHVSG